MRLRPRPSFSRPVENALGLVVVAEALGEAFGEGVLAGVTEGTVADVVAEGDGLGEILVEAQGAGDGATHLGDLEGVREARDEVVLLGGDEDLGLVLEAAEGLGVDDAVTVALEGGADGGGVLGAGARRGRGARGEGAQSLLILLDATAHMVQVHAWFPLRMVIQLPPASAAWAAARRAVSTR